ncbi:MAG: hypothetical protein LBK60_06180 [Verrucomicrobiales bacterium]|nr:hypothetical protein [Verrucomicrobiales bacterium]
MGIKLRCLINPNKYNTRGSALVIILAFTVLLTGLIMAFFMRAVSEQKSSSGNTNRLKADLFAQSAADLIIADLKEEIVQGSDMEPTVSDLTKLYFPKTPADMLPKRGGNPAVPNPLQDPVPNLIRTSHRDDTLASAVSSTTSTHDGRLVKLSRWNQHYLIPRQNTDAPTDCTPVAAFIPPDWIFVTTAADSRQVLTAPDPQTIGRYACAIYDEGGLLDLNVAGHPPLTDEQIGVKGSLALADLTVLTGTDNQPLITTSAINALVSWRNHATMRGDAGASASADNFLNYYVGTGTLAATATNGLLTVNPLPHNNRTDQAFTSRQSLIRFQRATPGFSPDALQFLTHFTRDLEQPSFRPDPARPRNLAYQLKSANQTNGYGGNDTYDPADSPPLQQRINPALLKITGTDGQPLLKRRFPLSRLSLLKHDGDAALIKKYFGLVWNPAEACWNYNASDNGPAQVDQQILKLDEITGREPNFFEILKAAIHCDSLGKQHGGNDLGGSPTRFIETTSAARDGSVNYHLLQIGAAIIDQYDGDSYPTTICFGDKDGNPKYFHGIEDLPYLYGWNVIYYPTKQLTAADLTGAAKDHFPAGGTPLYEVSAMLHPIVWNPHAPSATTAAAPNEFRITTASMTAGNITTNIRPTSRSSTKVHDNNDNTKNWRLAWWSDEFDARGTGITNNPFPLASATPYHATINPANSLDFKTAPATTFREPYRLYAAGDPAGADTQASQALAPLATDGTDFWPATPPEVIGFYLGKTWAGPLRVSGTHYFDLGSFCNGNDLTLSLKYKNPYPTGPAYLTYSVIECVYLAASLNSGNLSAIAAGTDRLGARTGILTDPRNDRWGTATIRITPFPATNTYTTTPADETYYFPQAQPTTLAPSLNEIYRLLGDNSGSRPKAPMWKNNNQAPSDLEANLTHIPGASGNFNTQPAPGGKFFYADPDGIIRRAMGGSYHGTPTGLPLITNNHPSRPLILNRPFKSVTELAYAFRGLAWRQIDFTNPESGDSALLDAFCLNELSATATPPLVAGRLNLNTRQPQVLAALIRGVAKDSATYLTTAEARRAATALVLWTSDTTTLSGTTPAKGPLRNRAELVGKYLTPAPAAEIAATNLGSNNLSAMKTYRGDLVYSGYSSLLNSGTATDAVFTDAADYAIARRRASVLRALADSGNVRVWNLLIDLIAQTGRYPANATDLSHFNIEGETHLWLHLAIDRLTGEVIAKQIEPIYE